MTAMPLPPPLPLPQPVADLIGICRDHQSPDGPVRVLDGVDLTILPGDFVAIIGGSGSGKSTLLNLVGLLDRPTAGRLIIDGIDTGTLDEAERARFRRDRLGFVFQFHHLIPELTLLENAMLPCGIGRRMPQGTADRIAALLDQVGLAAHRHKLPSQVSGGQQQRAAIVRALANQPRLVLADEPTGNLDQTSRDAVFQLLRHICKKEGRSVLMVTHDHHLAVGARRKITITSGRITDQARRKSTIL